MAELSEEHVMLIGIILSVIIQVLMCGERCFKRIKHSECKKTANGSISISVENTPKGSANND